MMRNGWMMAGMLLFPACVLAGEGRYEALSLGSAEGGGTRALILDSREGHVWVWTENELVAAPDGSRRYKTGFVYQGRLRPGARPGEMIEPQVK
jgi:hypothetical protein